MPKSSNQKLKLLYLSDLLLKKTDEEHSISMKEIIEYLEKNGITAERKSIYDDFEALRNFGIDIISEKGRNSGYYAISDKFELAELKLLVDAVQSSNFITSKKSDSLIKKLQDLCSEHQAKSLQRFVYVNDRIKTENESIYYTVDGLHTAIASDKKISFKYYGYSVDKKRVFRKDGARYIVSPIALLWDDEKYYLLGFDEKGDVLKHYRVDKITELFIEDKKRDYVEKFNNSEVANYSKKYFSMYGGEEVAVTINFDNSLIGVAIDRFGKDVIVMKTGEDSFNTRLKVVVSAQFFGWLCGFGDKAKIVSPETVKLEYLEHLKATLANQLKNNV